MAGICGFGNLLSGSSFHGKVFSRVPLKTYSSSVPMHPVLYPGSNNISCWQDETGYGSISDIPCKISSTNSEDDILFRLEQAVDRAHHSRWHLRIIVDTTVLFDSQTIRDALSSTGNIDKIYSRFWSLVTYLKTVKEEGVQILIISHDGGWGVRCKGSELTLKEQPSHQLWIQALESLELGPLSARTPKLLHPITNGLNYGDNPGAYTGPLAFDALDTQASFVGLFRKEAIPLEHAPVPLKVLDSDQTEIIAFPVAVGNVLFPNFFHKEYKSDRYDLLFDSLQRGHTSFEWNYLSMLQDTLTFVISTDAMALQNLGQWYKEQNYPFIGVEVPLQTHLEAAVYRISQPIDEEAALKEIAQEIQEGTRHGNRAEEIASRVAQNSTHVVILQEKAKVMSLKKIAKKIASPEDQKFALEVIQEIVSR